MGSTDWRGHISTPITPNICTHNYLDPVSLAIVLKNVDEGKASSNLSAVSILTRNSTGIKFYKCTGAGWDKVKKPCFFFFTLIVLLNKSEGSYFHGQHLMEELQSLVLAAAVILACS